MEKIKKDIVNAYKCDIIRLVEKEETKMIRVMTKSIKNKEVIVLLPLGSEFLSF